MVADQLPQLSPEQTASYPHVLVVDDDEAVAPLLAMCLEMEGYRVATAGGGKEALALLKRRPLPGLVVLDMKMPEMDGLAVLSAIRSNPETAALPVAMMSGLGDVSDTVLQHGIRAEYCLPKPIALGELRRLTRKVCGSPQ